MNAELDRALVDKYAKIFKYRNEPVGLTAMGWGFDCGDGWYNIIDQLCSNIQNHINWTRSDRARGLIFQRALLRAIQGNRKPLEKIFTFINTEKSQAYAKTKVDEILKDPNSHIKVIKPSCEQVTAVQVKEKFGSLRFYYSGGDNIVKGMVRMAEAMSEVTCEECGAPGELRNGRWIRTLCDTHATSEVK